MSTRPNRKLSAILAADVAGYSRLMSEDEPGTLARLRTLRTQHFEPSVDRHHGRVIKSMGDGWLVEFGSAVDAVSCALEIQRSLQQHSALKLRMGVHIGDIVHEGEDIFGTGVNIAARLQEAVEPGGVAMSELTYTSVRGVLDEVFADAGSHSLKNIATPHRIYTWNGRVQLTSGNPASASDRRRASIIVLPFAGASGAAEVFGQGLTDTLITALSRFSWFLVLPRSASRAAAGEGLGLADLRRLHGVSYAVEGTLRAAGNRVRINVELLDAASGQQVWSGHFDGESEDPFEMEDRISRSLLAELLPRILGAEARRVAISTDGSAWDLVMQGRHLLWHVNEKDVAAAQELFRKASDIAPDTGIGQSDLAWSYIYQRIFGWGGNLDETAAAARSAARAALTADDADAYTLAAASFAALPLAETDDAMAFADRAVVANPHLAVAHAARSLVYFQLARYEEATVAGDYALELGPRDPLRSLVRAARGMYFLMRNMTAELEENARAMIRDFPGMPTGYRQLAVAHAKKGDLDAAHRIVNEEILRLLPGHTATESGRQIPFGRNDAARRYWVDCLVKAGLPR